MIDYSTIRVRPQQIAPGVIDKTCISVETGRRVRPDRIRLDCRSPPSRVEGTDYSQVMRLLSSGGDRTSTSVSPGSTRVSVRDDICPIRQSAAQRLTSKITRPILMNSETVLFCHSTGRMWPCDKWDTTWMCSPALCFDCKMKSSHVYSPILGGSGRGVSFERLKACRGPSTFWPFNSCQLYDGSEDPDSEARD